LTDRWSLEPAEYYAVLVTSLVQWNIYN